MSNGTCPTPFLPAASWATTAGYVNGRLCAPIFGVECCLPCPKTDYLYPDNFRTITNAVSWVNIVGAACCVFLLASYAALPVEKTHRHYLSICLTVSALLMQLGFIIPLAANPAQCADPITPNDMHSSPTCAASGAILLAGGGCAIMWIFLRAFALHLQICWQKSLGNNFMWGAFAAGWGIPAGFVAIALALSGVSFRFGATCHINHKNSLADFWIPLLVIAGATVVIQFSTFGYCIKVYLASLADSSDTTTNTSGLPSYEGTIHTITPRQAYRRVRRVIELQWRGITIVLLILVDVIFFAVVFVFMDNSEEAIADNPLKAEDWAICLMSHGGDKNQCLQEAAKLVVNEATVMAVLVLLSLNGIWLLLLLGRFSMFNGWYELAMNRLRPNKEFVSVDALVLNKDPRSYEMLSKESGKTPEPVLSPVSPALHSGRGTPDYFGREARYHHPTTSFSSPKPPQSRPLTSNPPLQQNPYRPPEKTF